MPNKFIDEKGRQYRVERKSCFADMGRIGQKIYIVYDDGSKEAITDTVHNQHRKVDADSTLIRHCLEAECEDCKETSEKTASCRYGTTFVGKHNQGPMAVSRGQDCHYNRPPMHSHSNPAAQSSKEVQPELNLT